MIAKESESERGYFATQQADRGETEEKTHFLKIRKEKVREKQLPIC
jgi:hypothetical protein